MAESEDSAGELAAWERRLSTMVEIVERWEERTAAGLFPLERSALAGDDSPNLKVSSIATYSLACSVEHLGFALQMMQETGTMYPTAYLTTLRSALLAASHAVWVLAPASRAERRGRAMRLQVQDLTDQRKMLQSVTALTREQEALRDTDVERLNERLGVCHEVVDELSLAPSSRAALNNTDVITAAAKHLHADPQLASASQLLWRVGSAAAHAQRSFAIVRMNRNVVRTETVATVSWSSAGTSPPMSARQPAPRP